MRFHAAYPSGKRFQVFAGRIRTIQRKDLHEVRADKWLMIFWNRRRTIPTRLHGVSFFHVDLQNFDTVCMPFGFGSVQDSLFVIFFLSNSPVIRYSLDDPSRSPLAKVINLMFSSVVKEFNGFAMSLAVLPRRDRLGGALLICFNRFAREEFAIRRRICFILGSSDESVFTTVEPVQHHCAVRFAG